MLGLETVTGTLDHFGFEDYLNGNMIFLSLFCFLAVFITYFNFCHNGLAELCLELCVVEFLCLTSASCMIY